MKTPNFITDKNTVLSEKALSLASWISTRATEGGGPFLSATDLAAGYLKNTDFKDDAARIQSMIQWESAKNFGTGFVSGFGGIATLPATIPASLGASWAVQARLAAAIASIHGHDVFEDRVRTLVLLSLIGSAAKDELKRVGIEVGKKMTRNAIRRISGHLIVDINRAVGFRLIAKAGEKGVFQLSKLVPIAGGIVGGIFDGVSCHAVGKAADALFAPQPVA